MKYLEPKAPTSTKFYMIDYSKVFAGDTINQVTVLVSLGSVIVTRKVFNNQQIGFLLAGGVIDETTELSISLRTTAGQVLEDTASIFIVENEADIDFDVVLKQQIIEYAMEDLRLSGYIFDHTPDELSAILKRLDGLMRKYRLKGMDTGYNHPKQIGLSNLNDIAGIPDGLAMDIGTLTAEAFMEGRGKQYTPGLAKKAEEAFNSVYSYCKSDVYRTFPKTTPRGAGGKRWSTLFPFFVNQPTTNREGLLTGITGQYIGAGIWDESLWG